LFLSSDMFRMTLAILLLAVAATQAKTRRTFLPQNLMNQRKYLFSPDEKIVGGEEAMPGSLPHQISFQQVGGVFGDFHFCGGSILNAEWIICAAHCVAGENFANPQDLQIVAGEHDMSVEDGNEQRIPVDMIVMHEDYDSSTISNDISLLHLATPIMFNDFASPIALPAQMQESTGDSVISGWGTLSSGATPDVLNVVTVPIITDEECRGQYGEADIFDHMICAGLTGVGGIDSCQGDSGGPMICDNGSYLCGIVSWGQGCGLPNRAGVYTEVSHFVHWIEANAV